MDLPNSDPPRKCTSVSAPQKRAEQYNDSPQHVCHSSTGKGDHRSNHTVGQILFREGELCEFFSEPSTQGGCASRNRRRPHALGDTSTRCPDRQRGRYRRMRGWTLTSPVGSTVK